MKAEKAVPEVEMLTDLLFQLHLVKAVQAVVHVLLLLQGLLIHQAIIIHQATVPERKEPVPVKGVLLISQEPETMMAEDHHPAAEGLQEDRAEDKNLIELKNIFRRLLCG